MAYKAGNLEVELLGIDNNAVVSINNTAKALSALSRAIDKINGSQFVLAGQKLEHIFTKIASATKSIDTTNLTALASAGKSLSAISRIGNLEKVDFTKIGKGFNNLSVAITPFLEKVKSAEASLTALYGTLSKASGKNIQGLLSGDSGTPKSKKGGFGLLNLAKWTGVFYMARRVGRVISNIVQAGADYTETLNLWETAMGSNLNVATEFVNKMNEAYGISEKTLMNAQAIFKNMLGSLGQISDTMAYSLSEGITQMALDYASLYNVTFEQAFTKFQAALAGQVRPIRSVAGYDITENTLYQLYQSLGGTKTMRQLTRTEKQLLSILAIFNQMTASGAVGDLDKTMESFANQSRVMAESWQQVKTYAGALITYTIQESGLLTYLNAILMFIGDTLKAVAESIGAIQHFGGDIFENTTESALGASEAIDEVQGKLLDFDKFRAMSGGEENALGLDEKLLQALSGYDTILGNASMKARELAENLKMASGLFNEDGTFNKDKWDDLIDSIKSVGIALGVVFSVKIIDTIITFTKKIFTLKNGMLLLNLALVGGVVYAIMKAVDAFKQGDIWAGILATTIGITLAGAFIYLHRQAILKAWQGLGQFLIKMIAVKTFARGSLLKGILGLSMGFVGLGSAVLGAFALIQNWGDMNTWQRIIGIIGVATTAILGLAMAFGAFHSAWSLGLASAGIVAGIAMIVGSIASVKKDVAVPVEYYADGGLPDKGTLFRAGEAGAEIVYNTPSGQSGVVNVQQIEQAMYGALIRYGKSNGGNGQPIEVYLDGEKVYQNTTAHAKRRGNVWGKA